MKLIALLMMIMEEETVIKKEGEKLSDVEDFNFSDLEDLSTDEANVPLSIDCNGRFVSDFEKCNGEGQDNCDMHFIDRADFQKRRGSENRRLSSTEDFNISDEEEKCYNALTLQTVSLDGIACVSSKHNLNPLAALNFTRIGFKDQHSSVECASDDEMGSNMEEKYFVRDKYTHLNPGYTFADHDSSVNCDSSTDFLRNRKALSSLNIKLNEMNSKLDENNLQDLYDEPESPPMTCLEFLKSEFIDDCETDAEDISVGSPINEKKENRSDSQNGWNVSKSLKFLSALPTENILHVQGAGILYAGDSRRSSAAGFLTEDETLNLENFPNVTRKKLKKRDYLIADKNEVSDDSLTDEEVLDAKNKEWTETDDSGGVRQITQIKTETSIKLEGEGDDLGIEGDDIISRTTTTTTRIVTTVTTDGEQESHDDQHTGDSEDLRHSVEVILNQFMSSDSDAIKLEDSTVEHDE